jgi:hypothetical protein
VTRRQDDFVGISAPDSVVGRGDQATRGGAVRLGPARCDDPAVSRVEAGLAREYERADAATPDLSPLSERILERLPGSRAGWIAAWALVPWANAGANVLLDTDARSAVWEQGSTLIILNYLAVSLAIVVCLWGSARIARRVETLHEVTSLDVDATAKFREIDSVAGPLALSVAAAVSFGVSALVADGWVAALLRGTTWLILGFAVWSFVWVYGALQVGFHRLGRERLLPDAARVDPTLGMRPFGALAGMALWMLLVWLVPLLVTGLPDVVGVVIGVAALAGALAAFFYSVFRFHRQMVEVKEAELEGARALYAEAYEPVRAQPTLAALERQHGVLGAADALEKRAQAIHEWPIDEGTVALVITITTSVTAVVIGRLVLSPLGL